MIKLLSDLKVDTEYDHVLCVMARVIHDSRTLNLADSLIKKGDSTAVVAYATEKDIEDLVQQNLECDLYYILWPDYDRMFKLWLAFLKSSFLIKNKLRARTFWAMDLYAIPFTFLLKSQSAGRIIYDAREVYTALGTNVDQPGKQRIISMIERFFIHKVDKVIVTGELDGDFLVEEYGIQQPEILLNLPKLKNWSGNNRLRTEMGIPADHKIIVYQGLIYKGRGVNRVIEALPYLKNVTFVAIGSSTDAEIRKCKLLSEKLNVSDRFKWKSPVPYGDLMNWTAEADIGLCFIEPLTLSLKYALPNKLFEYCMAGIPVLATDMPQMKKVLDEIPAGKSVSSGISPKCLAAEIEDMLKSKNNGNFDRFIQQMRKKYNWDAQMTVIERLDSRRRNQ